MPGRSQKKSPIPFGPGLASGRGLCYSFCAEKEIVYYQQPIKHATPSLSFSRRSFYAVGKSCVTNLTPTKSHALTLPPVNMVPVMGITSRVLPTIGLKGGLVDERFIYDTKIQQAGKVEVSRESTGHGLMFRPSKPHQVD